MPADLWVHAHIPKCGGSTFRAVLARNFGDGLHTVPPGQYLGQQMDGGALATLLSTHPGVRCFSSHRLGATLPADPDRPGRVVSLVREPFERFVSHYFFHRYKASQNDYPETQTMAPVDYFRWAIRDRQGPPMANFQTWFLTGCDNRDGLATLTEGMACGQLVLLPLHRFDDALLALRAHFPDAFSDLRYGVHNPGRSYEDAELAQFTDEMRADFEALSGCDLGLVEQSEALLSRMLESSGLTGVELDKMRAEHQRANRALKRRNNLRRWLRGLR